MRAFYLTLMYLFLVAEGQSVLNFSLLTSDRSAISYEPYLRPASSGRSLSKFFLFTPKLSRSRTLDARNRDSFSDFDPTLGTKIIIHGFLDSVSIAPWMHDMKDQLLTYSDYNVIIVDWSSGNSIPYSRAAANTPRVGQEISEMVQILLNDYGARPETFHLIGHSLGSHIAGFVGEHVKGIGRITGLDPAAPRFESEDSSRRLDPTDALFVDVIHSDAGGIGMEEATGHQDFYPNGGREQPGCTASNTVRALVQEGVIEGVRNIICSHMRAPLFFTASINNRGCQMVGILCNTWDEFKSGRCIGCGTSDNRCAVMGFHASPHPNQSNLETYYLLTGSEEPYCAHDYRLTFDVEYQASSALGGLLKLRLNDLPIIGELNLKLSVHGSEGNADFELDDNEFSRSSDHAVYIVPSTSLLGKVDGIIAQWVPNTKTAKVLSAVTGQQITTPVIRRIEITPVKFESHGANLPETYIVCSQKRVSELNTKMIFRSDYC